jgi:hypothetical protein
VAGNEDAVHGTMEIRMRKARRIGPAFGTNALQGFSCSGPVGRLCQAASRSGK